MQMLCCWVFFQAIFCAESFCRFGIRTAFCFCGFDRRLFTLFFSLIIQCMFDALKDSAPIAINTPEVFMLLFLSNYTTLWAKEKELSLVIQVGVIIINAFRLIASKDNFCK